MDKLRAENFDFALTEHFDVCGMAVFERIGVKKYGALIASTLSNLFTAHYGVPSTLSFVPGKFGRRVGFVFQKRTCFRNDRPSYPALLLLGPYQKPPRLWVFAHYVLTENDGTHQRTVS